MGSYRKLIAFGMAVLASLGLTLRSNGSAGEGAVKNDTTEWTPLPGRAIGILVRDASLAMREMGYIGADNAYGFASGPGGYRWLYCPCPGEEFKKSAEPITVKTGEHGMGEKTFNNVCVLDAPLATHINKNLSRPFTLVNIEVNGGLGCPATDSFVATDIRVIDGVLDPTRAVEEARKLFLERVAQTEKKGAVAETLSAWVNKLPAAERPSELKKTAERVLVTWLADRNVMHVEWRLDYRAPGGRQETSIGTQAKPPGGYRGPRQAAPRRPAEEFVIELAMEFEYGKGNVLTREGPLRIRKEVHRLSRAK